MRQTWHWPGPGDGGSIGDMLQAGVQGAAAALCHIPPGGIRFLHLRKVRRKGKAIARSFFEGGHLGGQTDMAAREERRDEVAGRPDGDAPMRRDHGQTILDDIGRRCVPGYPATGRLKGRRGLRGMKIAPRRQPAT